MLYVGRLTESGNLANLLKALPLLRNAAIPLVVVGPDMTGKPGGWTVS